MVQRPIQLDAFEFAVLASLRVLQLRRGCTPRVAHSDKITVTAQMEVAEGKVVALPRAHPIDDATLPLAVVPAGA